MRAWMILPLVLFFHLGSLIASTSSDWFLQPEELARLKNSGITENVIQTKVEQQQLLLSEKWTQAQGFQFAPKVIPSVDIGRSNWSIQSASEMLLELRGDGGYLSTKTRAEVVARQLNRALLIGDGQFTSIQHNGQSALEFQGSGARFIIVAASAEDAFSQSNANSITQNWATVLNRFWKSLPPAVLRPLPEALTFPDLVLLAKTRLADRILISFLDFREIDPAVKANQINDIGFSKQVTQYLARRVTLDVPDDRMRERGYYGSHYCGYSSISISTTISVGGSGTAHFGGHQHGSSRSASRGASVKGSSAGLPGKNSPHR